MPIIKKIKSILSETGEARKRVLRERADFTDDMIKKIRTSWKNLLANIRQTINVPKKHRMLRRIIKKEKTIKKFK